MYYNSLISNVIIVLHPEEPTETVSYIYTKSQLQDFLPLYLLFISFIHTDLKHSKEARQENINTFKVHSIKKLLGGHILNKSLPNVWTANTILKKEGKF